MDTAPPAKKRKTLHDFFSPTNISTKCPRPLDSATPPPKLHADTNATEQKVPGLSLEENFISPTEESALLAFLDAQPWRSDLSRPSIHYGGTYCLLPPRTTTPEENRRIEQTIITAPPIPPQLTWLVDRMVDEGLYNRDRRPEYCIVNAYSGNVGISAHVENFRFGEPVCGLTLGWGDWMRFHELTREDDGSVRSGKASKAERTGRRVDVWLPRRSLVVMRGESRRRWQHEIVRSKKGRVGDHWRRVSLTFRVEKG